MTLKEEITSLQVFQLMAGPDKEEVLAIIRKYENNDAIELEYVKRLNKDIQQRIAELTKELKTD